MNLRSCAKCGCHAVFLDGDSLLSPDSDGFYYVMCDDDECTNDPVWGRTEEEAGRNWNEQQLLIGDIDNNCVGDEVF